MLLKNQIDSNVSAYLTKFLLEKYSVNVPRYTSYPPAPEWTEKFKIEDFLKANEKANQHKTPISLYFHLPFCESQCYFCACNVVISKKKSVVRPYLESLKKEILNLSRLINKNRKVEQIHLGGGTPTYFTPDELTELYCVIGSNFNISENCEIGVEVDPRVTSYEHLKTLVKLGFNRISMGIQDFNPNVQESINRFQPYGKTQEIFEYSRKVGFESINIDLVYGLPFQTKKSFIKTIDLVLKLNPDRIALFHYAHLPKLIPHQAKYIFDKDLPSSNEKIEIFQYAVQALTNNNFVFIGLDHFAKVNDDLAKAKKNKTLHRNFQGYTTKANCDLYGLGITAISNIHNTFSQNIKRLNPYYSRLEINELPIFRGILLTKDDLLRREIIMKVLCHGVVVKPEIEEIYQIKFDEYFTYENDKLIDLRNDGLIEFKKDSIEVTSLGQFFLRNIASAFDLYLQKKNGKERIYSKSI